MRVKWAFDHKISRQKIPLRNFAHATNDSPEPRAVGPFLAAQKGSCALSKGPKGWVEVGSRRVGRSSGPQGVLGALALGGFLFPCLSLSFKGHPN